MKAAIFQGVGKIEAGEQPDPVIKEQIDAIVRVVLACVCGSDLWYYRGITPHPKGSIGHEFIGVVEEVGSDVKTIQKGDFVREVPAKQHLKLETWHIGHRDQA